MVWGSIGVGASSAWVRQRHGCVNGMGASTAYNTLLSWLAPAYGLQTVPGGVWLRHVTHFKFGGPVHISGMAEARRSNLVYRWAISSSPIIKTIKKSPQKGRGYGHVTYLNS